MGTGVDEREVRKRIFSALDASVSLDAITPRQVRAKVEQDLGYSVGTIPKQLLQDSIDEYLNAPGGEEAGDAGQIAEGAPRASTSFKASAAVKTDGATIKSDAADDGAAVGGDAGEWDEEGKLELGNSRFANIQTFKGKSLVNIREWYKKEGKLLPGMKGASLPADQWHTLVASVDQINAALASGDTLTINLSATRRLSVTDFKGMKVDIREFWQKENGEMSPGKKGIMLQPAQWHRLCAGVQRLTDGVGAPPAAQAGPAQPAQNAQQGVGAGLAAPPGSPPPVQQAQQAQQAGGALPIMLGQLRRADLSEFKGKTYVSIREFYEKNGEQLPGSKGLNMATAQFQVLYDNKDQLNTALENRQNGFEVNLDPNSNAAIHKIASVSIFKNGAYASLREHYQAADGAVKPGKKGINLTLPQWATLYANMDALKAAADGA